MIYSWSLLFSVSFNLHLMTDTAHIDTVHLIIDNALSQTKVTRYYDPSYIKLRYPGGDVPMDRGVCTDVIIRALRAAGIDLQKEIHIDMTHHFSEYPSKWGLKKPDSNIDHRRVPNIQTYLKRMNRSLPVSDKEKDYHPGDIVTWKLPGDLPHIGIVSDIPVENTKRYGIIHNIGGGTVVEDALFLYQITGHYRY